MTDRIRSTAYQRFLMVVTAMTLVGALGGGLGLVVRATKAAPVGRVEFAVGSGPGSVILRATDDPGDLPFTEPVAVDLALDPVKLVLPPLNAVAAQSPHRIGSMADRIVGASLVHRLAAMRDDGVRLGPRRITEALGSTPNVDGRPGDLVDGDGDGVDDDGRFTVTAVDGSAVCVTIGAVRRLAVVQRLVIDPADGTPTMGIGWSPYGPCGDASHPRSGSELRVGTTPGTYGGVSTGEVCDIEALARALDGNAVVGAAWAAVHGIPPEEIGGFLATLTPVVLLTDTRVTDYGFDNGLIRSRQIVMERGTAVLIDRTGAPRLRCVSGSPVRAPRQLADPVVVVGEPWRGFALEGVTDVPASLSPVTRFVLVDIRSAEPLVREAGAAGSVSALAGPIVAVAASTRGVGVERFPSR